MSGGSRSTSATAPTGGARTATTGKSASRYACNNKPSVEEVAGAAVGFAFSAMTRSQHPGWPIELCAGVSPPSDSGQQVSSDTMPVIRHRRPTNPDAVTARASNGATSAAAIDLGIHRMARSCFGSTPGSTTALDGTFSP